MARRRRRRRRVPAGPDGPLRRARVPVVRQGGTAGRQGQGRVVPTQRRPAADRRGARRGPAAVGRCRRGGVPRAVRPVVGPRGRRHQRRGQQPAGTAADGRRVRVGERALRQRDRAPRAGRRAVVRMTARDRGPPPAVARRADAVVFGSCTFFFFVFSH